MFYIDFYLSHATNNCCHPCYIFNLVNLAKKVIAFLKEKKSVNIHICIKNDAKLIDIKIRNMESREEFEVAGFFVFSHILMMSQFRLIKGL